MTSCLLFKFGLWQKKNDNNTTLTFDFLPRSHSCPTLPGCYSSVAVSKHVALLSPLPPVNPHRGVHKHTPARTLRSFVGLCAFLASVCPLQLTTVPRQQC